MKEPNASSEGFFSYLLTLTVPYPLKFLLICSL